MSNMSFLEKLLDGVKVEWKALGGITTLKRGRVMSKGYLIDNAGDLPVYSSQTVNNGMIGRIDTFDFDGEYITWTTDGANAGTVFYRTGKFSITNVCGSIKINNESRLNYKFLFYWLSIEAKKHVYSGMGNPKLMSHQVEKVQIPIPCPDNPKKSLEIQAEIVRILDTFTELTAELTAELNARKKQYNYYRDQLLSFEDGEVECKTLGEISRVFSASRVHKNEWATSGVPFYRTSDVISIFNGVKNSRDEAFISKELYETLSLKSGKIQKDDILVTGGGTIGIPYIARTDEPLYFKDADLLCIKKSEILNSKFLYHYFLSTKFRIYLEKITHNSTIAHYTISQIKKTPVPVPPLEEQARIVTILDKFDALTKSITEGLPREIALRQKQYEYYRDLLLSFPSQNQR